MHQTQRQQDDVISTCLTALPYRPSHSVSSPIHHIIFSITTNIPSSHHVHLHHYNILISKFTFTVSSHLSSWLHHVHQPPTSHFLSSPPYFPSLHRYIASTITTTSQHTDHPFTTTSQRVHHHNVAHPPPIHHRITARSPPHRSTFTTLSPAHHSTFTTTSQYTHHPFTPSSSLPHQDRTFREYFPRVSHPRQRRPSDHLPV